MGATDVDTRTDVYALGVVLYELLSGLLPFDSKTLRAAGIHAICRIIREQEPPRPSTRLSNLGEPRASATGPINPDAPTAERIANVRHTQREQLARELRRELDWIPLKAIRKDRAERYETPMDLAQDIGRYLKGEALKAGPESAAYRLRKLVRRNSGPVVAGAAVVMALVLGLGGTLWQAGEARRETAAARAAETEQSRLRQEAEEARAAEAIHRLAAEDRAYAASLAAADESITAKDLRSARQRLDSIPQDQRGFEWNLLQRSADTSTSARSLVPRGGRFRSMDDPTFRLHPTALSPDGRLVCYTEWKSQGHSILRCVDAQSGLIVATLDHADQDIQRIVFGPDSRHVATVSVDMVWVETPRGGKTTKNERATVRVWDLETQVLRNTFATGAATAGPLAFSGNGELLAVYPFVDESAPPSVAVWSLKENEKRSVLKSSERVTGLAVDLRGLRVCASIAAGLLWWDVADGGPPTKTKTDAGVGLAWNFENDTLVCCGHESLTVWHATNLGNSQRTIRLATGPECFAVSPEQAYSIVTGYAAGSVQVYSMFSSRSQFVLNGHFSSVIAVRCVPEPPRVVALASDGEIRTWDLGVSGPVWSPDTSVRLGLHSSMSGDARGLAFDPSGTALATIAGDEESSVVVVWNLAKRRKIAELQSELKHAQSVRFGPGSADLTVAGIDGTAETWDWRRSRITRRRAAIAPDTRDPFGAGVELAADGRGLAIFSDHGETITLSAFEGPARESPVQVRHPKATALWAESMSGLILCTSSGGLWRWENGEFTQIDEAASNSYEEASMGPFAFHGPPQLIDVSPARDRVVWANGTCSYVASLRGGPPRVELRGHTDTVTACAFDPTGTRVVTGSQDGSVRFWNAATGTALVTYRLFRGGEGQREIERVAFSSNGQFLALLVDGATRIYDLRPAGEVARQIHADRALVSRMQPKVEEAFERLLERDAVVLEFESATNLSDEERTAAIELASIGFSGVDRLLSTLESAEISDQLLERLAKRVIDLSPRDLEPGNSERWLTPRTRLAASLARQKNLIEATSVCNDIIKTAAGLSPQQRKSWDGQEQWARGAASVVIQVARDLMQSGAAETAEPLMRGALDMRRACLSPNDIHIASAVSNLGECLATLGRAEEAEPLLLQAVTDLDGAEDASIDWKSQARDRLVRFYEQTGRPEQAAKYRAHAPK